MGGVPGMPHSCAPLLCGGSIQSDHGQRARRRSLWGLQRAAAMGGWAHPPGAAHPFRGAHTQAAALHEKQSSKQTADGRTLGGDDPPPLLGPRRCTNIGHWALPQQKKRGAGAPSGIANSFSSLASTVRRSTCGRRQADRTRVHAPSRFGLSRFELWLEESRPGGAGPSQSVGVGWGPSAAAAACPPPRAAVARRAAGRLLDRATAPARTCLRSRRARPPLPPAGSEAGVGAALGLAPALAAEPGFFLPAAGLLAGASSLAAGAATGAALAGLAGRASSAAGAGWARRAGGEREREQAAAAAAGPCKPAAAVPARC